MEDDVDAELGAEDVLADVVVGIGIVECVSDTFVGERHLSTDVEEALRESGGVARN